MARLHETYTSHSGHVMRFKAGHDPDSEVALYRGQRGSIGRLRDEHSVWYTWDTPTGGGTATVRSMALARLAHSIDMALERGWL